MEVGFVGTATAHRDKPLGGRRPVDQVEQQLSLVDAGLRCEQAHALATGLLGAACAGKLEPGARAKVRAPE